MHACGRVSDQASQRWAVAACPLLLLPRPTAQCPLFRCFLYLAEVWLFFFWNLTTGFICRATHPPMLQARLGHHYYAGKLLIEQLFFYTFVLVNAVTFLSYLFSRPHQIVIE